MTWGTPSLDLRTLLSDGPTDKVRYRKKVFGELNGTNKSFRTLEFRRLTNFTTAVAPLGVWLNGSLLAAASVSVDYIESGDFNLVTAPVDGDRLEASYYIQWFTDTEISQFLRLGTNWLGLNDDYTGLLEGLRPAVLKYAASEAYQKLALRWAESIQETFLLNDATNDKTRFAIVDQYRKSAEVFRKDAEAVRDDFYSRSGQQKQPLFASIAGAATDVQPKR
jgi:hypothetical protein